MKINYWQVNYRTKYHNTVIIKTNDTGGIEYERKFS